MVLTALTEQLDRKDRQEQTVQMVLTEQLDLRDRKDPQEQTVRMEPMVRSDRKDPRGHRAKQQIHRGSLPVTLAPTQPTILSEQQMGRIWYLNRIMLKN